MTAIDVDVIAMNSWMIVGMMTVAEMDFVVAKVEVVVGNNGERRAVDTIDNSNRHTLRAARSEKTLDSLQETANNNDRESIDARRHYGALSVALPHNASRNARLRRNFAVRNQVARVNEFHADVYAWDIRNMARCNNARVARVSSTLRANDWIQ